MHGLQHFQIRLIQNPRNPQLRVFSLVSPDRPLAFDRGSGCDSLERRGLCVR